MSSTLDLKQNISLSVEGQWLRDGAARNLTGFTVACKVKTNNNVLVHEFTYETDLTWVDQTIGKVKLEVLDVSSWPTGLLKTDVIFTHTSSALKSGTIVFNIDNSHGVT